METLKTTVIETKKIADNTVEIKIKKPKNFEYKAGQYAKLICTNNQGGSLARPMSFSSAPHEKTLSFSMRLSDSPFKKIISDLKPKDSVEIMGPLGRLAPKEGATNIFIAGGIGITPFRSIIIEEASKGFPYPIYLFYSEKTKASATFLDELLNIQNPNFTFIPTLTQEKWNRETGRINYDMIQKYIDSKASDIHITIIGTTNMVLETKELLLTQNIDKENLQVELFGYSKEIE